MIGSSRLYARWVRDLWRAGAFRRARESGSALVVVLFHGLFRDRREVTSGTCDPQQGITSAFFAEFVESLLTSGAAIREVHQAVREARPGLTVAITFDDGYANNDGARQVLERFGVPATFYISTRHVEEQKAFWWDVLYREGTRRGVSPSVIAQQGRALKLLTAAEIEGRLTDRFGRQALAPTAECDRPFTTGELRQFARSPQVYLGNHTSDHGILVNYDSQGIREQIVDAQRFLADAVGVTPTSIAYPNGNCDDRVTMIAREAGLELGLTVQPGSNRLPTDQTMTLRRLTIWSTPGAARQARAIAALDQGAA